jgi:hypothetical protein
VQVTNFDLNSLLPAAPNSAKSFRYRGSLTTPPYGEGVQRVVLAERLTLDPAQIAAFTDTIHEANSREPQPLYGRTVLTDVPGFAATNAANITVTTIADGGPGSLRQALVDAGSGGTITFAPALSGGTISLTSGQLVIRKNLSIYGPGADQLAVGGARGWLNPEWVVPVHRRCLEKTNAHVRDVALQGLLNCGAVAAWAEPEVAALLLSTNSDDRRAALRVLIAAGTMRDETRLQVAGLLHDRSQSVVALAALALWREAPIDREMQRLVADSLTGPLDRWSSVFLQWQTAAALGLAGTNAAPFLPALRPLLNHPTNEVRRAVIEAVRRIEGRSR